MDLIKEVQMIETRKDIKYLLEKDYFNKASLSKAIGINPKVLRDFIVIKRTPQDAKFYMMREKIKFIMQQIKEVEDYEPSKQYE